MSNSIANILVCLFIFITVLKAALSYAPKLAKHVSDCKIFTVYSTQDPNYAWKPWEIDLKVVINMKIEIWWTSGKPLQLFVISPFPI